MGALSLSLGQRVEAVKAERLECRERRQVGQRRQRGAAVEVERLQRGAPFQSREVGQLAAVPQV